VVKGWRFWSRNGLTTTLREDSIAVLSNCKDGDELLSEEVVIRWHNCM
jgi:hypothetical protein